LICSSILNITRCPTKELDIELPTISKQAQEMLQMTTNYIANKEGCNEVIHATTLNISGDLVAEGGFIHAREAYPDFPDLKPLQIEGKIRARIFDATKPDSTDDLLQNTFVPEVHYVYAEPERGIWYDSYKVIKRASQGLSIWKEAE
jgi:hypothetical protein